MGLNSDLLPDYSNPEKCFNVCVSHIMLSRHEAGSSAAVSRRSDGAVARPNSEASSAGRRPRTGCRPVPPRPRPTRRSCPVGVAAGGAMPSSAQRTPRVVVAAASRPPSTRQVAIRMLRHGVDAAAAFLRALARCSQSHRLTHPPCLRPAMGLETFGQRQPSDKAACLVSKKIIEET